MNAMIYLVDDETEVLDSLKWLIESVGYEVKTYTSAEDLCAEVDFEKVPSCMVLDVRMPGMSGLEVQDCMKKHNVNIPIIFITGHGDIPMAVRAMKNGATEFLTKPLNNQMLLEAINKAIKIDTISREHEAKEEVINQRLSILTLRERDVFNLMVTGMQTKLIASELGISPNTVELHRGRVMKKMEVKALAELVRIAICYNLVDFMEEELL